MPQTTHFALMLTNFCDQIFDKRCLTQINIVFSNTVINYYHGKTLSILHCDFQERTTNIINHML
jgi:hypothetical protein